MGFRSAIFVCCLALTRATKVEVNVQDYMDVAMEIQANHMDALKDRITPEEFDSWKTNSDANIEKELDKYLAVAEKARQYHTAVGQKRKREAKALKKEIQDTIVEYTSDIMNINFKQCELIFQNWWGIKDMKIWVRRGLRRQSKWTEETLNDWAAMAKAKAKSRRRLIKRL